MLPTDELLLARLKNVDAHDAWQVFYDLYWQPIVRYARKLGLAEAQAHEVLQDTMVTLMNQLPHFRCEPQRGLFRNFLLTIVHRRAVHVAARQRRERRRDEVLAPARLLPDDTVREDAVRRWQESVFESVFAELQTADDVTARDLAIFRAVAMERRPAAEVAGEHDLTGNAVYQVKSRLLRRLRDAVRRRLRDSGDDVEF